MGSLSIVQQHIVKVDEHRSMHYIFPSASVYFDIFFPEKPQ
jgi:hypothetical protein